MHRIFVVGCARSGTTLTQALIASHSGLVTVPETHFFTDLPARVPLVRELGLASLMARERLEEMAERLEQAAPGPWWCPRTVGGATETFISMLDRHASEAGADGWVEKTPYHLRRVDLIETHVPGARFCHVLRRGRDVVASLYDAARRHPQAWGGERSIDRCVERWLDDVETSFGLQEEPGHVVVRYDRLAADPEETVGEVWASLGLPRQPLDAEAFREASRQAEPEGAPWQRVGGTIDPGRSEKFEEVLTPDQQERVLDRLREEGRERNLYWRERPLFE